MFDVMIDEFFVTYQLKPKYIITSQKAKMLAFPSPKKEIIMFSYQLEKIWFG